MSQRASAPASRRQQRGLSLLNLIVIGIGIAFVLIVLMPTFPALIEYRAVQSAVDKAVRESDTSPPAIRKAFDRSAAIDDITSITGKDLVIERGPDGPKVSFAYQRRFKLFGPASLVFDFQGSAGGH